ncbi:hypothetical protein QTP88_006185 [Uroleucon formosanum]
MSKDSSKVRKIDSFFGPSSYAIKAETETTTNKKLKVNNATENEEWEVQSNYDSSVGPDNCSSDSDDCQQLNDLQEIKNLDLEHLYQKQVTEIQIENVSKIGPSDITHIVSDQPTQPILKNYPRSKFGKEWRQFRPEWFKSYPWLKYSVFVNACYCFPCRFFSSESDNSPFYKIGFKNLKKALDKNAGIKCHNKSWAESLDRGNFLELLELCARRDTRFKAKIDVLPKNAKYTHHTIQNDLFYVMSKLVLETIAKEVKEAKYFAILADETKDISKTEQLSIMALFNYINKTLTDCGIDIKNCIAQTYDGASVMSGKQNGVRSIFQQHVPQALYTRCFNHRLNLVIVDVCKNIPEIETFIALLQQLYNFVSRSTVHTKFIELQNKYLPKKENMELKRLCETRWICQISACIAVKKTFPVILLLLHKISLETKNSDLSSSCLLVESLINYLMDLRNTPNKFEDLLKEVELCAQKNNIQLPNEKVKETRFRKLPKQFSSYLTEVATAENRKISISSLNQGRPYNLQGLGQNYFSGAHKKNSSIQPKGNYYTFVTSPILRPRVPA